MWNVHVKKKRLYWAIVGTACICRCCRPGRSLKLLPAEKQLPHIKRRLERQRNNRKWHNRKELHWINRRNHQTTLHATETIKTARNYRNISEHLKKFIPDYSIYRGMATPFFFLSYVYMYMYMYITNCRQYCFGLLGLISAVLMLRWRSSFKSHLELPTNVVTQSCQSAQTRVH